MATPPPPNVDNPYQEGSLIFTMTTTPERANKLTPRWKGPYRVRRIPNHYQVAYEDGSVWSTVHINHTKPAKFTAPRRPALGYLPAGFFGISTSSSSSSSSSSRACRGLLSLSHSIRTRSTTLRAYRERDASTRYRARQSEIQKPLSIHGILLDSTLSLTGFAL